MMSEKHFKSPIENALCGCQFGVKLGKHWGYRYWILTPKERILSFQVPDVCAVPNFVEIGSKLRQTHRHTDTYTEITQVIL